MKVMIKWININFLIGEYKNDHRNGYGKYYWSDGEYYEGEWKDDLMHGLINYILILKIIGYGIYIWPDGKKYSGK